MLVHVVPTVTGGELAPRRVLPAVSVSIATTTYAWLIGVEPE